MTDTPTTDLDKIDYNARVFVCGMREFRKPSSWVGSHPMDGQMIIASGEWGPRFAAHFLCLQSDADGWARSLRGHFVRAVKLRMMAGQSCNDIGELMPDRDWIICQRAEAKRAAAATEWQARVVAEHGSLDNYLQSTVKGGRRSRSSFRRVGLITPGGM